jgi:hypothetical protein
LVDIRISSPYHRVSASVILDLGAERTCISNTFLVSLMLLAQRSHLRVTAVRQEAGSVLGWQRTFSCRAYAIIIMKVNTMEPVLPTRHSHAIRAHPQNPFSGK